MNDPAELTPLVARRSDVHGTRMKALVYHGPGQRGWDAVDDPTIIDDTFADAASTNALKVVLHGDARNPSSNGHIATSVVAGAA